MDKIREEIVHLREVAKEIATSGHYGWPNSVTDAADTMEAMLEVVEALQKHRVACDGRPWLEEVAAWDGVETALDKLKEMDGE